MDLGSPENGLEEISDLLKEDESTLAGELDPNLVVNKENAEYYLYDDLASINKSHVDLNERGQQRPPSLPSDFRYYQISGSLSENLLSPVQTGFDHDVLSETKSVCDQERLQPPSEENHHQEETKDLGGSYLFKSSFQVETETFHHEIETDVSARPQEFFSIEDADEEEEMEDRPTSPPCDEMVTGTFLETLQYELTKSESAYKEVKEQVSDLQTENLYSSPRSYWGNGETKNENIDYSRNSPAESRKVEMPYSDQLNFERTPQLSKSPGTGRQMSVSLETSPCAYQSPIIEKTYASQDSFLDLSYSSRSHEQKHCSSPERSDLGKDVPSKDRSLRAGRQNSASPQGSRQRSQHMDGSSVKRASSSPRNYPHQNHQRRNRSVSRSPVRQRDSSSGYKRDHRNRSRSRSPHTRDYHRRSPRRYSPRRRSPPSGYYSRRRSPKRRHWSPPHNRSTGVGKPGRNLFVAGFSFMTTERDLERKFSRFGHVRDVRIVRDKRSGDSRGFGFLSLERDEEADAAIRALDKTEWNGRIVLVEKSKSH